ncbi:hypothetical protein HGRIS_006440 [Hohenbuehelia grisea]|uniref:Uncharacterized protein n=1 Tax=Hohenbuehelia grisea TaxID=104357 RepID=A0ABR3K2W5_9AGAR
MLAENQATSTEVDTKSSTNAQPQAVMAMAPQMNEQPQPEYTYKSLESRLRGGGTVKAALARRPAEHPTYCYNPNERLCITRHSIPDVVKS